jgi:hypothetical protein
LGEVPISRDETDEGFFFVFASPFPKGRRSNLYRCIKYSYRIY